MKEIKEGTPVKCWDKDSTTKWIGFYIRPHDKFGHIISQTENMISTSRYDFVAPVALMPELPEGVKIGDRVEFYDGKKIRCSTERTLKAITSDGRFVDGISTVWDHCRPIRKEKRVKRLSEIIRIVEDVEGRIDVDSGCFKYKGKWWSFLSLASHCDKDSSDMRYPEEWLEELE